MKEWRSASQILFGFLPNQTVDLRGRTWKVARWRNPVACQLDDTTLRRELQQSISPWAQAALDGDYLKYLKQGREVRVYELDKNHGVDVEEYPQMWKCKSSACNRVFFNKLPINCKCGSNKFAQLPFVGYHKCGEIRTPYVRCCPQHSDLEIIFPGTASATEIIFRCPECHRVLQRGLGIRRCSCSLGAKLGEPMLKYSVHRASVVYTPQMFVIVNPPSAERVRDMNTNNGKENSLDWALRSFDTRRPESAELTPDGLVADLIQKGISETTAKKMAQQAIDAGELKSAKKVKFPNLEAKDRATAEAVSVALALDQSRISTKDLSSFAEGTQSERHSIYKVEYPSSLLHAGLQDVELVEKFPVLTGAFGYTRDGATPGESQLCSFMLDGKYCVYADLSETEALFIRLKPLLIVDWLIKNGHNLPRCQNDAEARAAILGLGLMPERTDRYLATDPRHLLFTLIHSYSHRLIRRLSVFAGIERNSLSEYIVPYNLGIFIYAAAKGDFVLGGLQAVFEGELHHLLKDFVNGDSRCPLDPGCARAGGACMACLHVGEPSCRYYNRFLSRSTLFGPNGYLVVANR